MSEDNIGERLKHHKPISKYKITVNTVKHSMGEDLQHMHIADIELISIHVK